MYERVFSTKKTVSLAFVAVLLAALVWASGLDKQAAAVLYPFGLAGAFFAGLFYTIGFTTPTALIVIVDLMRLENPLSVALAASLAAAAADSLLFAVLKNFLEKNSRQVLKKLKKEYGKFSAFFFTAGFLVFGSPLPDEFGLAFLQLTRVEPLKLAAIVFLAKLATLLLAWHIAP